MKFNLSAALPAVFLTTIKSKAARFNSPDDAVKFGTSNIVKAGGMSKVVKVDGSFGEVSNKPEVVLEITAVSSVFNGVKSITQLEVPHYVMYAADGRAELLGEGDKVEGDIAVPMSKTV